MAKPVAACRPAYTSGPKICDLVDPLWWICIKDSEASTACPNSEQVKFKAYRHLTIKWPTHWLPIQAFGFKASIVQAIPWMIGDHSLYTGKKPLLRFAPRQATHWIIWDDCMYVQPTFVKNVSPRLYYDWYVFFQSHLYGSERRKNGCRCGC